METALKPNLRPSSFNAARNERMASACALPIVDLPHNDTPDTPALPTAKIGGYDCDGNDIERGRSRAGIISRKAINARPGRRSAAKLFAAR
jgi:hypothetical protein